MHLSVPYIIQVMSKIVTVDSKTSCCLESTQYSLVVDLAGTWSRANHQKSDFHFKQEPPNCVSNVCVLNELMVVALHQ